MYGNGIRWRSDMKDAMKSAIALCTLEIIDAGKAYDNKTREMLEKALTNLVEKILMEASYAGRITSNLPIAPPLDINPSKCSACAIEFSGTMGYNCQRSDCPMKARIGSF